MANAMRKMAVYLGLVEEDEPGTDEYGTRGYDDRRDEAGDSRNGHSDYRSSADRYAGEQYSSAQYGQDHRGRDAQSSYGSAALDGDRLGVGFSDEPVYTPSSRDIVQIEPRSYNDARRIGDDFRSGSPVLLNLGSLSDLEAKRLVDFGAGLVFGLRGSIERVTSKVFLLSPSGVDASAEARAIVQESQQGLYADSSVADVEDHADEAAEEGSAAHDSSTY